MIDQSIDNKNKIIVIKIGGSTLGEGDSTIPDIISIKKSGYYPVIIHGGGKEINEWTDGAFTAPHMCSLFAVQRKDATTAKEWQFSQKEKYYQDSIRLLSLLLVTNNTFGLRN